MASGSRFVAGVLDALTADPRVWSKTVLFYTYDENGGFFDHVSPPTPPPSVSNEYYSLRQVLLPTADDPSALASTEAEPGPVGLGFRVPMTVISPFSRGGLLSKERFDHTSLLRFVEARFGVRVPNLSSWRRSVTGDLTQTLDFSRSPAISVPALPNAAALERAGNAECSANQPLDLPSTQRMPEQEAGGRPVLTGAVGSSDPAPVGPDRIAIHVHGVPRRLRSRGLRVRVDITHSRPLRQVEVHLNGRRIVRSTRASFTFHVGRAKIRLGGNRLTVTAIETSGHRGRRSIVVRRAGTTAGPGTARRT